MLPCKEIVRILSSGEELPLVKRFELRLHLMMCKYCSRFARHLRIMKRNLSRLFRDETRVKDEVIKETEKKVLDSLISSPHSKH